MAPKTGPAETLPLKLPYGPKRATTCDQFLVTYSVLLELERAKATQIGMFSRVSTRKLGIKWQSLYRRGKRLFILFIFNLLFSNVLKKSGINYYIILEAAIFP